MSAGLLGGARAVARCDVLGVAPYSDMAGGLYRGYLTPAHARALEAVAGWMTEAGMRVSLDPAANLVGHYAGTEAGPPLLIGSHIDSVRDAGRYDGPLGIMLGIELVAALAGERLPFAIEVIAFGDEEGSRFPAAMLTSRAVAGTLDADLAAIRDGNGVDLGTALRQFEPDIGDAKLLSVEDFARTQREPGAVLAYVEAHIEQGPVLEAEGLPLATVSGIAAQRRYRIAVAGVAGHAGTTSMPLRRDALAGAAAMIGAVEAAARAEASDLVATVGSITVAPGAANVIPAQATFTLDIRAADASQRDTVADAILAAFAAIAAERGLDLGITLVHSLPASPCDPRLMVLMDAALAAEGQLPRRLVSGAGHDAMIMAALCPTAMLFVRCRGGVSHNPAEHVDPADADAALAVLLTFVKKLAYDLAA